MQPKQPAAPLKSIRQSAPVAVLAAVFCSVTLSSCAPPDGSPDASWWKGNLHTHSLWSDGDQVPELIVDWYVENGYDFLAISDHNTLQEGKRWKRLPHRIDADKLLRDYRERFGDEWVQHVDSAGGPWVRLKTLEEYRPLFERENEFLLLQSEEISDRFENKPIHLNATNIQEVISPQGGSSVLDVLQRNVDAVRAQSDSLAVPVVPHINHPNFVWALSTEDLVFLQGDRLFEVYNGHPLVNNYGDADHISLEVMWDAVNAERVARGYDVLYGIATDDAHNYHDAGLEWATTGRGWIFVSASELTAKPLLDALENGRFYASSGVVLDEVAFDGKTLTVVVDTAALAGTQFEISFIGTRADYEPAGAGYDDFDGALAAAASGEVFSTATGGAAAYTLTGDELYVRALVRSDRVKSNPYAPGEVEQAWVQPVQPGQSAFRLGQR